VLTHVVSEYGHGPEITLGRQKDSYGQTILEQVNLCLRCTCRASWGFYWVSSVPM